MTSEKTSAPLSWHWAFAAIYYGGGGLLLTLGFGRELMCILDALGRPFGLGGAKHAATLGSSSPLDTVYGLPITVLGIYYASVSDSAFLGWSVKARLTTCLLLTARAGLGYLPPALLWFGLLDGLGALLTIIHIAATTPSALSSTPQREANGSEAPLQEGLRSRQGTAVAAKDDAAPGDTVPAPPAPVAEPLWRRLASMALGSYDMPRRFPPVLWLPILATQALLWYAALAPAPAIGGGRPVRAVLWSPLNMAVFVWAVSTHLFLAAVMLKLDRTLAGAVFGVVHNGCEVNTMLIALATAWRHTAGLGPYVSAETWPTAVVWASATIAAVTTALQLQSVVAMPTPHRRLQASFFYSILMHYPTMAGAVGATLALAGRAAMVDCRGGAEDECAQGWRRARLMTGCATLWALHVAYEVASVTKHLVVRRHVGARLPAATSVVFYSLQVLASALFIARNDVL